MTIAHRTEWYRCVTCDGWGHLLNGKPSWDPLYPLCPECGGTGGQEVLLEGTVLPYEVCPDCHCEGRSTSAPHWEEIECQYCGGHRVIDVEHDTVRWLRVAAMSSPTETKLLAAAANQIEGLRAAVVLAIRHLLTSPLHNEDDREFVLDLTTALSATLEYDGLHATQELGNMIYHGVFPGDEVEEGWE